MNPVTAFVIGFFCGAFFGLCLMAVLSINRLDRYLSNRPEIPPQ